MCGCWRPRGPPRPAPLAREAVLPRDRRLCRRAGRPQSQAWPLAPEPQGAVRGSLRAASLCSRARPPRAGAGTEVAARRGVTAPGPHDSSVPSCRQHLKFSESRPSGLRGRGPCRPGRVVGGGGTPPGQDGRAASCRPRRPRGQTPLGFCVPSQQSLRWRTVCSAAGRLAPGGVGGACSPGSSGFVAGPGRAAACSVRRGRQTCSPVSPGPHVAVRVALEPEGPAASTGLSATRGSRGR